MPALVPRDALISEELRGAVLDGEAENSVDKLPEGKTVVRISNGKHAECLCRGFGPNFRKAGRGAVV